MLFAHLFSHDLAAAPVPRRSGISRSGGQDDAPPAEDLCFYALLSTAQVFGLDVEFLAHMVKGMVQSGERLLS